MAAFTVTPEEQRRRRAEHLLPGDGVVHHAGVVSHVGGLHLGDVQAPRLLRDEPAAVLLHELRVFVEDPRKRQPCDQREKEST